MTTAQNPSVLSLEGPEHTKCNKLKHCYFHLGHMCTCCLPCQEYPLRLGCDGFTTLVWSWGFTCWMKLYNVVFFMDAYELHAWSSF